MPTSNAPMLTWLGMPPLCQILGQMQEAVGELLPPVSKKRLTAAGLAAELVRAVASVIG